MTVALLAAAAFATGALKLYDALGGPGTVMIDLQIAAPVAATLLSIIVLFKSEPWWHR